MSFDSGWGCVFIKDLNQAAYIRINLQLSISDNFSYKCFQYLGIQSQTRHKIHYKPRKVKDKYPNLIYSTWDTVDRPRQVIVSDMTVIKYSWFFFELTMYFDVFTKEILTWHVAERRGHRDQYIDGLNDVINLLKGTDEPTVLHTDQGSVYASLAYNELIKDTLIVRSMSRAGKPTDNPVNESLNGWIKEELFIDFKIETCNSRKEFEEALDAYVDYYNEKRPCYAIGYDTPNNYRKTSLLYQAKNLKGTDEPTVLHTDQGSVYASLAYNELIKDTMIVRSMSRAGKPTDNPVNESLNGWIKEELFIDFKIETCNSREEFEEALDAYVDYYNEKRPCYAIGYDTPNNYRKRFYKGELPRKDTFGKREANATPKFVTERKKMAGNEKNKE